MTEPKRLALLYAAPLVWYDRDGLPQVIHSLDFKAERESLFDSLKEAGKAVELRIEAATADNFRTLTTLGYHALHYSGHGNPDFLAFEDGQGATHKVDPQTLQQLFSAGGTGDVQFVFVSACHSRRSAEAFVIAGVPHVVAVRLETPVYDDAARQFARHFYLALLSGKTVREAFDIGRVAVRGMPGLPEAISESEKFLLLPESGTHDAVVLDAQVGVWKDVTPPPGKSNLPAVAEHFVGRNVDMHQLISDVLDNRLVTLKGPPGIGKTALSISVAHYLHLRRSFGDGVFFVSLREVKSSEAMRFAMAQALGINPRDEAELFAAIGSTNCLFVLDNCETPLYTAGKEFRRFLSELLQRASKTHLLLTSRLALGGGIPGCAEKLHKLERLDPMDAAQLFATHSPRRLTWQEVGATHLEEMLESLAGHPVLNYLSGHPHAISLTAPLLEDKPLDQLEELLRARQVDALTVVDVPEDELDAVTSLAKSLGVSVDYVRQRNPDAIRLFSVMGLLPAGATPQDLHAVWGNEWRPLMDVLVRASLIERMEIGNLEHFSTFPFIRDFAGDLFTSSDREIYSDRACEHFASISESLHEAMGTAKAARALELFERQEANLWACIDPERPARPKHDGERAAPIAFISYYLTNLLKWSNRIGDGLRAGELGLEACRRINDIWGEAVTLLALGELHVQIGHNREAESRIRTALVKSRAIDDKLVQVNALRHLGDLKRFDDPEDAEREYERALELSMGVGLEPVKAQVLLALGALRIRQQKKLNDARSQLQEALRIFRDCSNVLHEAHVLKVLGELEIREDNYAEALRNCEEARAIYQQVGDKLDESVVLRVLGHVEHLRGNFQQSVQYYQTSLGINREIGARANEINLLRALGELRVLIGELDQAQRDLESALSLSKESGSHFNEAYIMKALGDVQTKKGNWPEAQAYYVKATSIFDQIADPMGEANCYQALAKLRLAEGNPDAALKELKAALKMHIAIGDRVGISGDLGEIGKTLIQKQLYKQAAIVFDKGLKLSRAIGGRHGEFLHLVHQADALARMGENETAVAALMLARELPSKNEAQIHAFLEALEREMGTEAYQEAVSEVGETMEAKRKAVMTALQEAMAGDSVTQEILRMLPQ